MTASQVPGFSIIIPTYNRVDALRRTLLHFLAQDYPADRYEIIVVDNSTDSTPEMVRQLASESPCPVRLLHGPERLPAIKRNLGLRAARQEYALFFNDDVWAAPDLLKEHARTHGDYSEPIAVLGLVEPSPEMPYDPFLEHFDPFAYFLIADRADRTVPYRFFWSMNLSLSRREMLERNLVFHEDWAEIGHEDIELGYRWTKAGRQIIYNPRARGHHYHPQTLASGCELAGRIGRGLRDLELLVPDQRLLERYGVFCWRNRPMAVLRGFVRELLFNRVTAPPLERWLSRKTRPIPFARWIYWKVLLYHVNRGYRQAPRRPVRPLETAPPVEAAPR